MADTLDIVPEEETVDLHELNDGEEAESSEEETSEEGAEEEEEQERDEEGKFKPKKSAQKRIDEITAARRQAERDLATERAVNATLMAQMKQAQSASQSTFGEPEPKIEDYGYDQVEHAKALGAWSVRKQIADQQAQEQEKNQVAQQVRIDAEWDVRKSEFATSYPDFEVRTTDPTLPITTAMAKVIKTSARGPELAYYLAENKELASEIAGLPAELQPYRLGLIESKMKLKQPTHVAPKPVTPVAGSGERPSVDAVRDMKLTPEQWAEKRNRELHERRYGTKKG